MFFWISYALVCVWSILKVEKYYFKKMIHPMINYISFNMGKSVWWDRRKWNNLWHYKDKIQSRRSRNPKLNCLNCLQPRNSPINLLNYITYIKRYVFQKKRNSNWRINMERASESWVLVLDLGRKHWPKTFRGH